jgi:NADPH:quinone reductase-like Zn-dependent oxidoreductase
VRGEFAFSSNCEKEGFPLGAEGAGVVVALGESVTSLQVGRLAAGWDLGEYYMAMPRLGRKNAARTQLHPVASATPQA